MPRAAANRSADPTEAPEAAARPGPARGLGRRVLLVAPQPFFVERGTPIAVRYVLEALSQLGFETPRRPDAAVGGRYRDRLGSPAALVANPLRARSNSGRLLRSASCSLTVFCWRAWPGASVVRTTSACTPSKKARCSRCSPEAGEAALIYDMASSLPEQLAQKAIFRPALIQALLRQIETYILRRSSVVMCSAGLAGRVRAVVPTAPMHEWRFPSAARAAAPGARAELGRQLDLTPDAPVVLYTGNFAEYQGVDLVFDAIPSVVRQVPGVTFVLVGAASQTEVDAAYARLGEGLRPQVRCIQRQPRERIDAFVAIATVLVSPRNYGGNFPLKVFDYLAAGKPIVATDVPTHRAVLDDSLALLVSPSAAAVADGIARVLKDQELAAALASAAGRFGQRELSWGRFIDLIDRAYGQALEPQTAPAMASRAPHV